MILVGNEQKSLTIEITRTHALMFVCVVLCTLVQIFTIAYTFEKSTRKND